MAKKALLLVGSPKSINSTSEVLGKYVLDRIKSRGVDTEIIKINNNLKSNCKDIINAVNNCDILILSSPLYVDSVPASVVKAMELIYESRIDSNQPKSQVMLAICNSGFPEAHQNHSALAIYRSFAKESGFEWAGGLALGGGGAINGKPLEKLGGMAKNVSKSLDLAADALVLGKPVPQEAMKLMEKPLMPNWLYYLGGQIGWIIQSRKYGAYKKINDRPYEGLE